MESCIPNIVCPQRGSQKQTNVLLVSAHHKTGNPQTSKLVGGDQIVAFVRKPYLWELQGNNRCQKPEALALQRTRQGALTFRIDEWIEWTGKTRSRVDSRWAEQENTNILWDLRSD